VASCASLIFLLQHLTNYGHSSKYLLAVVEVLLEVFGVGIRGSYNISWKFWTTLDHRELGPCAQEWAFKALGGATAFHGHAHNCLCQLSFLATYVKGMGLEDLEGFEHFFWKSNVLASSLQYASVFHQQQKMIEFMKHVDTFRTYANLSQCY
jgi:Kyakuja-Dileera-Zisupton transposase